jgi:hypothetical protein
LAWQKELHPMKLRLLFLTAAACTPLLAQVPHPVQLVGTGRAKPNFANAIAPSQIKNQNPVDPNKIAPKPQSSQPGMAFHGPISRASSKEAAEAWVDQYSADETTIDPKTGLPRFSTTVTLHQTVNAHGDRNAPVIPQYKINFLQSLMNFTLQVPSKK